MIEYNGVVLSNKGEHTNSTHNIMDESQNYYTKIKYGRHKTAYII